MVTAATASNANTSSKLNSTNTNNTQTTLTTGANSSFSIASLITNDSTAATMFGTATSDYTTYLNNNINSILNMIF